MSPPPRTKIEIRKTLEKLEERGLLDPLRTLARSYSVTLEDVLSRSRQLRILRARDACIAHLYAKVMMSSTEIGALLRMDHTSVLIARDRYHDRDNGRLAK